MYDWGFVYFKCAVNINKTQAEDTHSHFIRCFMRNECKILYLFSPPRPPHSPPPPNPFLILILLLTLFHLLTFLLTLFLLNFFLFSLFLFILLLILLFPTLCFGAFLVTRYNAIYDSLKIQKSWKNCTPIKNRADLTLNKCADWQMAVNKDRHLVSPMAGCI